MLWGNRWWSAEILKSKNGKSFIHYTGYGDEWNEWVGPDRMRSEPEDIARITITSGDLIVTGSGDGKVDFMWDTTTGEQVGTNSYQKESRHLVRLTETENLSGYQFTRLNELSETIKEPTTLPTQPSIQVEWHGRWWPAHVLKSEGNRHFIRYHGYGSEWDEWVTPTRMSAL